MKKNGYSLLDKTKIVIILNRATCALYKAYMHYTYVTNSCVEECLGVRVFMLVMRLAFTKLVSEQVQEQLCYSLALMNKIE